MNRDASVGLGMAAQHLNAKAAQMRGDNPSPTAGMMARIFEDQAREILGLAAPEPTLRPQGLVVYQVETWHQGLDADAHYECAVAHLASTPEKATDFIHQNPVYSTMGPWCWVVRNVELDSVTHPPVGIAIYDNMGKTHPLVSSALDAWTPTPPGPGLG